MTTQTTPNMELDVSFEEQFNCCICLDIYTKPATIPCGHTFCLDCIDGFWDTKTKAECPLCKETFRKRPELRINQGYEEIILLYFRSQEGNGDGVGSRRTSLVPPLEAEEIPCDICRGDKSPSFKSCLVCQASYCELHLTPHLRDPALHRHRLTDPATFATSHLCRKHHKPLTMFCKKDQKSVCVQCTERKHKHHQTSPMEQANKRVKIRLRETVSSIQPMIQARLRKVNEIKKSVALSKQITEREIESSAQVCSMLISAIERQHAGLVEELEKRQQEAERRAQELFQELEQELNDLQMRSSELQYLEQTRNPVHLIQSFPSLKRLPSTREWSEVAVHSDNCMGAVTRAVSKLGDICQELANKLSAKEADKLDQYAVNVTLDPDTASGWLVLSPDRKKVSISSKKNYCPIPDSPQRFDSCVCVLGKQSFASGRRYWVVEVGDKTDWDVGVARESINRKGVLTVSPSSGYWAICRRKGSSLSACAGPSVTLHLKETPKKVGVFLDYEEGSVSFYDAEAKTHIYTYSGCDFSELLYPYFNPCVQEDGKNAAPLIICPVDGGVREGRDITIESAA
ncbi:E3 ubiquitin-protein ligase TRIM39 isoform X3 [Etheostoma spectabile]|uniref:E3 ubiquitin-protein ligase TRIM39 isoform X3 n=1 Tax=Etheostoma spectabile TaxID=54343 RepID=UPI0013AF811B|nr:E3 ubiquitin-protein ligase TRIM39-like isoform X3 [Etheostoma spectabile]